MCERAKDVDADAVDDAVDNDEKTSTHSKLDVSASMSLNVVVVVVV